MTLYPFNGVARAVDANTGRGKPSAIATLWSAKTGGTQYTASTDVVDNNGGTGGNLLANFFGHWSFQASVQGAWLDTGSGERVWVISDQGPDQSSTYLVRSVLRRRDFPKISFSPALVAPALSTDVPAVITSGPGGLSPIRKLNGGSAGVNPPYLYNTPNVTFGGATMGTVTVGTTNYSQNQCGGQAALGAGAATPYYVEFDHYDELATTPAFALWFRNNVGAQSQFWIWVDGQPTTTAPITSSANSTGNLFYLKVMFNGARRRRVRIYITNADFGGIETSLSGSISPTARPALSVALLGDSYGAGTGATAPTSGWAWTFARMLDAELFNCAYGGTGYVTPNATTGIPAFSDASRVNALIATGAQIAVVAGSTNDVNASSSSVSTAATSIFNQIVAAGMKLVVVGVHCLGDTVASGNSANNAAIKTACLNAGGTFIDPITDKWVTGTGKNSGTLVNAPSGLGATPTGTSGTLAAGSYGYAVAATTAAGDTPPSSTVNATITAGQGVALSWTAPSGVTVTGYNIYRDSGDGNGLRLIANQGAATSYTDNGTAVAAGAPKPTTGISTGAAGNGSADVLMSSDGVHPTQAGHDNYARRASEGLRKTSTP